MARITPRYVVQVLQRDRPDAHAHPAGRVQVFHVRVSDARNHLVLLSSETYRDRRDAQALADRLLRDLGAAAAADFPSALSR